MKVTHLLLISLLIVGALFVPAVTAEEIPYYDSGYNEEYFKIDSSRFLTEQFAIKLYDISEWKGLSFVYLSGPVDEYGKRTLNESPYYSEPVTLKIGSTVVGHGQAYYNALYAGKEVTGCQIWIDIDSFDHREFKGAQTINIYPDSGTLYNGVRLLFDDTKQPTKNESIGFSTYSYTTNGFLTGTHMARASYEWENRIIVDDTTLTIIREINNQNYFSNVTVLFEDTVINDASIENKLIHYTGDVEWIIINPYGKVYTGSYVESPTEEPLPLLRTGTVTMTDHNGTTISGFSVKAVNYYTGVEYDVSTESDVATITLPMDRTVSMRNPQTGQYEDVPVGYYTFFVSKPGYKMTSEDGVRISVLPEEYSPYHFGDIIVTSEDGYLTGKHQFQILSRADKRILQTGTISAQSATTGEWYNTTVVDGIATLILPYDTSSPYYKYVGNYYVYATSPGYIPSEYATQISVRPDTQSEIRWILLTPIGGIPEAGNVTLRIQAFSDSWQEIPNAQIHIDGVEGPGWEIWETYTASSTGYLEISVPENSTYDITVYGEGYYSSSQRIEVGDTDPPLLEFRLYPTVAPTPTTQPTGWVTPPPTTQPSPGIPDEDDKSEGFLMEAIRGISKAFGVGFATGKTIFGMLLALAIGFATAKQLRGGAAEFGMGLLGGTMLGVLIGLLPIWTVVVLLLIVGMYIGYKYVGGGNNG